MVQATFLEQLQTLLKVFLSNKYVFYVAIIAISLFIILELSNKFKNKKILKILTISMYVIIFGILLFFYHESIFMLIDYLINNIFILLFFPNLAVYTLVIIIINIILVKSLIKNKSKLKHLNIIFFILFNIIFYLIIDTIIKNNINVYEQLNIYTNKELLILIEISMKLFLIWVILLLIINISNKLSLSFAYKKHFDIVNEPIINQEEYSKINYVRENQLKIEEPEDIPDYVDIKPVNYYNDFIDITPIKKKKEQKTYLLTSMDNMFQNVIDKKDMDKVFKNQYIESIMNDIEKLRNNKNDSEQIQKVYKEITLSEKDLTLDDYNTLIHQLIEIKNN